MKSVVAIASGLLLARAASAAPALAARWDDICQVGYGNLLCCNTPVSTTVGGTTECNGASEMEGCTGDQLVFRCEICLDLVGGPLSAQELADG